MLSLKRRLVIALFISLTFVTTLFTGCVHNGTLKADADNKPVKLRWVILSPGKQQDQSMVWEKFNEKLQEKMPGTTVSFEGIAMTDFKDKWGLMAASGEVIDLAWTGWMIPYDQEVKRGSYLDITEYLNKDVPELKKSLPDWVWDLAKVNGKIYSVPNYQMMAGGRYGMRTPKALADKYLDKAKAQQVFESSQTMSSECLDVIEEYLAKLKQNNEIRMGVSTFFPVPEMKGYDMIGNRFVIKQGDKSFTVKHKFEIPETKMLFDRMAAWYKKGYVRKDSLSVKNPRTDEGKENGYTVWFDSYMKGTEEAETKKFGFPVTILPFSNYYYMSGGATSSTSTAVARTSKNPVKALKLLELLQTENGKDLYNMLVYGIENVHYKKLSDNRIETVDYVSTPDDKAKYGLNKWVIGNTFNAYETQADIEGYNNYIKTDVNEASVKSPLLSFKISSEKVKVELAQIDAVIGEYLNTLGSGALPNEEDTYNKFIEKMTNAGLNKVKAEIQAQVDEYVKSNNIK